MKTVIFATFLLPIGLHVSDTAWYYKLCVFQAGALDKLESFVSFNGPDFYGLPRNTSKLKLSKTSFKVPDCFSFPFGEIIPMFAGETLEWQPSFN